MTIENKLVEYFLGNVEEIASVVSQINSYDGSLQNLEVYENDEDFFNTYFENNPHEAVRASFYGDYRYMDEYVMFNGYANLESLSEYQYHEMLKDNLDDIIERLIDIHYHLSLDDELENILLDDNLEDDEE